MSLLYARAFKGNRVRMPIPFNRGCQLSLIGAISLKSVEAAVYGEWATNGEIFEQFLEQSLVPKLTPQHIILLDNISFHKSARVIEKIEETGAHIDYLPPYSPELNPIELMWSFIKTKIKTLEPRNPKQMAKALKVAFQNVTQQKLTHWFAHAGYQLTQ